MDTAKIVAEANRKNIVFSVTPGRSGTTLLTNLLSHIPDTESVHEYWPGFDIVLPRIRTNPVVAAQFMTIQKLPQIAAVPQSNYVETSHLFCLGFLEATLKMGVVFRTVDLRRNPRDIALSMYGYNAIPARTLDGLSHYLSPDDPGVLPLPRWTSMHDYQLCFWHCLEVERRQRKYSGWLRDRQLPVHTIEMNELSNFEKFLDLCQALELHHPDPDKELREKHRQVCAVNQNPKAKSREIDFDAEHLEKQVLGLVQYYEPFLWEDIADFYQS